jgi:hypothetical protein
MRTECSEDRVLLNERGKRIHDACKYLVELQVRKLLVDMHYVGFHAGIDIRFASTGLNHSSHSNLARAYRSKVH